MRDERTGPSRRVTFARLTDAQPDERQHSVHQRSRMVAVRSETRENTNGDRQNTQRDNHHRGPSWILGQQPGRNDPWTAPRSPGRVNRQVQGERVARPTRDTTTPSAHGRCVSHRSP